MLEEVRLRGGRDKVTRAETEGKGVSLRRLARVSRHIALACPTGAISGSGLQGRG